MKHKTEDYKLSAVKYYLKHKISMKNTCDIFECSKKSLSRWYPLTGFKNQNRLKDRRIF
jgi:hypothetical protein